MWWGQAPECGTVNWGCRIYCALHLLKPVNNDCSNAPFVLVLHHKGFTPSFVIKQNQSLMTWTRFEQMKCTVNAATSVNCATLWRAQSFTLNIEAGCQGLFMTEQWYVLKWDDVKKNPSMADLCLPVSPSRTETIQGIHYRDGQHYYSQGCVRPINKSTSWAQLFRERNQHAVITKTLGGRVLPSPVGGGVFVPIHILLHHLLQKCSSLFFREFSRILC